MTADPALPTLAPHAPPDRPPAFHAAAYLARIGHHGPVAPTAATLRALHLAHLRAVPFENLDIHLGRPIRLDPDVLSDKIVRRRRGGFCYELNGLFAGLLRALGFRVDLLAAQFPRQEGVAAPEFDHLTLFVHGADGDGSWLADVGAGRGSFVLPLRFETSAEQPQPEVGASFRLVEEGGQRRLLRRERSGAWEPGYAFTLWSRRLRDFAAGCRFHQTSPNSHFTRGLVCTLLTARGRITLAERRLIETVGGERTEWDLADDEYWEALRTHFGIALGDAEIATLLAGLALRAERVAAEEARS